MGITSRKSNVDFLKLLCSFLIVLFHSVPAYSIYTQGISNCAVPCFFMISGYLLYSDKMNERCLRSAKKTAIILLWSTAFYLPLLAYRIWMGSEEIPRFWEMLFNFLVFNENPAYSHLWYLSAYIYVLLIVCIFNKHGVLKILFLVIPLLWLIDMIGGISGINTIYLRNFLFTGLPCFATGMLVKKYSIQSYLNNRINLVFIILLCVGCIVESQLYSSTHQFISTSLLAIPLLFFFLSLSESRFDRIMSHVDVNDSLYIYIFHPAVMLGLSQINKLLSSVWRNQLYPYVSPFVIFFTTYSIVVMIRFIYNTIKKK